MHLMFGLLIFVLFIVLAVLFAAGSIIRGLFGGFNKFFSPKRGADTNGQNNDRTYTTAERRAKVFGPNEGEYVEYEEIKEDK